MRSNLNELDSEIPAGGPKGLRTARRKSEASGRKSSGQGRANPVSIYEGGYGKPLGSKSGTDLSGLLKIKLRDAGLRIVYKLVCTETSMLVIVIGARADDAVYKIAEKRAHKHEL